MIVDVIYIAHKGSSESIIGHNGREVGGPSPTTDRQLNSLTRSVTTRDQSLKGVCRAIIGEVERSIRVGDGESKVKDVETVPVDRLWRKVIGGPIRIVSQHESRGKSRCSRGRG